MAPTAPRNRPGTTTTSRRAVLADLGRVGFDDGRTVEVLVALTHAARLATNADGVRP